MKKKEIKFSLESPTLPKKNIRTGIQTIQEITSEGTENIQFLSFEELRQKFNKGGDPLFPKAVTGSVRKKEIFLENRSCDVKEDDETYPKMGVLNFQKNRESIADFLHNCRVTDRKVGKKKINDTDTLGNSNKVDTAKITMDKIIPKDTSRSMCLTNNAQDTDDAESKSPDLQNDSVVEKDHFDRVSEEKDLYGVQIDAEDSAHLEIQKRNDAYNIEGTGNTKEMNADEKNIVDMESCQKDEDYHASFERDKNAVKVQGENNNQKDGENGYGKKKDIDEKKLRHEDMDKDTDNNEVKQLDLVQHDEGKVQKTSRNESKYVYQKICEEGKVQRVTANTTECVNRKICDQRYHDFTRVEPDRDVTRIGLTNLFNAGIEQASKDNSSRNEEHNDQIRVIEDDPKTQNILGIKVEMQNSVNLGVCGKDRDDIVKEEKNKNEFPEEVETCSISLNSSTENMDPISNDRDRNNEISNDHLIMDENSNLLLEGANAMDAINYYLIPVDADIVVKPSCDIPVIKRVKLKFDRKRMCLTMIRKSVIRYIRLVDVVKIESGSDCTDSLEESTKVLISGRFPVITHFKTTEFPMIICCYTEQQKDYLTKLLEYLRGLLKSK